MRFAWLKRDLESSRRTISYQSLVLLCSLGINVLTALIAYRSIGHERVIVVPPSIEKSFWIETGTVSAEYLEQMGYFLIQLALNVTPQNVDYQSKLLLQYAAPASYGEIKTTMAVAAARLKRDGASTVFNPRSVVTDERHLKVALQGSLTTFIGDRRVSDGGKAYLVQLEYALGKLTIQSLKEVNVDDPLDTRTRSAVHAGG